jgi:predicted DNA-binding ribbon-helix-helix protein
MCEYFVKADPIQYEQRTRTIRIHGVLTSIRLENMVWDILAEMAEEEGCTTNHLIVQFHDEILAHRGEVPNFASFLRVTGMRFLRRKLIAAERDAGEAEGAAPKSAAEEAASSSLPSAAAQVVPMVKRSSA